jgi:membrane associated rhomboid family serine protease
VEQKHQDGVRPAESEHLADPDPQQAPSGIDPRDGRLDFSTYSLAQLQELKDTIDRHAFPANYRRLCAALARRTPSRQSAPAATTSLRGAELVRFTPHDGWRGWLHALLRRMPLYGSGSIDVMGPNRMDMQLLVQGWQLSWFGVPEKVLLGIGLERISNVACEHNRVIIEYEHTLLPPRPIEVQMRSAEAAQGFVERLPAAELTPALARWMERRALTRRLDEITPYAWVTPGLVMAILAVFVLMIAGSPEAQVDPSRVLDWGASFGPLTLNGAWWRLLCAAFLHWTPVQLLVDVAVLWTLGRLTERLYGSWPFLLIYAVGAAAGSGASLFWDPGVISLGAAGGLWGVFGALLVFILSHRRDLPVALWRALLPGTLILLAFTGLSAFINTGVDLAACAGGLVGGLCAGACLMRAPRPEARRTFPFKPALAIFMLTPLVLLLLLWQTIPARLTPAEEYFRQHEWLTQGAAAATAQWQGLLDDLHHGRISDRDLQKRFEAEVLPFWRSSAQQLQKEARAIPAAQRTVAELTTSLAQLRLTASTTAIAAVTGHDKEKLAEAQRLSIETNLAQARVERVQLATTMSYRARGARHSAALLALQAYLWPPRCIRAPAAAAAQEPEDAGEAGDTVREKAGCKAQRLFLAGDYAALDALLGRATGHLGDLPDGGSTLAGIDAGLAELLGRGRLPPDEALTRTTAWQQQLPGSSWPAVMEARVFQAWARQARDAGQGSPDAWLLSAAREAMSADALAEGRAHGAPGPLWYVLSLSLGQERSATADSLRGVFDEGIQRFPQYLPLYRQMLRLVAPGRPYEKIDSLIRDISQAHAQTDVALYARLYLTYSELAQDQVNIFSEALAQWPLMKAGLIELRRKYPASDYFLNAFAKSACEADDLTQLASVRPLLDARFAPDVWSARVSLAACDEKLKASQAAPDPLQAAPGPQAPDGGSVRPAP